MPAAPDAGSSAAPDAPVLHAPPCPNCGTPVADRYCPRCGQRYADRLPSLRSMAVHVLDDELSLNGTVPRTLVALFFRPGLLTREYAAGRIVRYLRPFRLFLVSSVIFFITLTYRADADALLAQGEVYYDAPPPEQTEHGPRWSNVTLDLDSASVPQWIRPLVRRVQAQEDRLNSVPPRVAMASMMDALLQASAKMSFLLVPAFAALLLALHFRRRRKYVEHFVFALHLHAFTFLLLAPLLLFGTTWLWLAAVLWWTVYLLIALKRAYDQSWALATVKWWVVSVVYPILLSLAVGIASLLALLLA